MPRWLGLTSPAMRSTASGTTPSHRDRQIKLLYPDRPLGVDQPSRPTGPPRISLVHRAERFMIALAALFFAALLEQAFERDDRLRTQRSVKQRSPASSRADHDRT